MANRYEFRDKVKADAENPDDVPKIIQITNSAESGTELQHSVSKNIQKYRKMRGYKTETMATKLGVKDYIYKHIERDYMPTVEMLKRVSEVLNVSLDDIIGRDMNIPIKWDKELERLIDAMSRADKKIVNHLTEHGTITFTTGNVKVIIMKHRI